jgi:large subunit ribosomal protein L4
MELPVLSKSGKDTGRTVNLSDDIFGITPNDHAIYLDVKQYLANQRQGTHKAKERAEVAGSTKKLKKQKGTGGARAGSIKSPLMRGGGRVFGPRPRDYSFKLNKKLKVLARKSALAYKASATAITVLEDFTIEAPKTKEYLALLQGVASVDKKTLLILPAPDRNVILSGRNLQKAKVTTVDQMNTYDLLYADTLLISESSISKIEELFNQE